MLELAFWYDFAGENYTQLDVMERMCLYEQKLQEKQEHMIGRIFHIKHIKYCMLKISIIFSCVLPLPIFCLFTILHFPTTIVVQRLLRIQLFYKNEPGLITRT